MGELLRPGVNGSAGRVCHEGAALRVLLAGGAGRRTGLEQLLSASGASSRLLPEGEAGSEVVYAERQLRLDMADVVLIELGGSIGSLLEVVGRLRAAAAEQVVFLGLHCEASDGLTRCYREAVVDAVLYTRDNGRLLLDGIEDAVETVRDLGLRPSEYRRTIQ